MFLSHFALGLASKRTAPAVSLGTLLLSCQLADIIWPNFVLLGVEQVEIAPGITTVTPLNFISYPYSHSLFGLIFWAALATVLYRIFKGRSVPTISLAVIAGLVLSHWVLDVISHRPDVPIGFGPDPKLGFELWRSMPATMLVEFGMFAFGAISYTRVTEARDRTGTIAFLTLVGVLAALYLASVFGPPPPSSAAVAWSAEGVWLFVIWGYWIDRHRRVRMVA